MEVRVIVSALWLRLLALAVLLAPLGGLSGHAVRFPLPVLVTAAGQGVEVAMASALFKKAGIPATVAAQAGPADLEGRKTLVLVPGFSLKGLGSAGLDRTREMARVQSMIAAAQKANARILVLHLGGKARRGPQSDDFNRTAAAAAHYLIVVKSGDEDRFFTRIAAERQIAIELVNSASDVAASLGRLFPSPAPLPTM
jgi:hypothetical protein